MLALLTPLLGRNYYSKEYWLKLIQERVDFYINSQMSSNPACLLHQFELVVPFSFLLQVGQIIHNK